MCGTQCLVEFCAEKISCWGKIQQIWTALTVRSCTVFQRSLNLLHSEKICIKDLVHALQAFRGGVRKLQGKVGSVYELVNLINDFI